MAIRKLQQIHAATHPGAKLEREPSAVRNQDDGDGQKTALLAALDAEGDEEQEK